MAFMGPSVHQTKKKSGKLVGYPPQIPDIANGQNFASMTKVVNGSVKKPNK